MTYTEKLDKKLADIAELETGDGWIVVTIQSYSGGEARVGMVRKFLKRDGSEGYGKLGRVSYEELTNLVPALIKAREWMENNPEDGK